MPKSFLIYTWEKTLIKRDSFCVNRLNEKRNVETINSTNEDFYKTLDSNIENQLVISFTPRIAAKVGANAQKGATKSVSNRPFQVYVETVNEFMIKPMIIAEVVKNQRIKKNEDKIPTFFPSSNNFADP